MKMFMHAIYWWFYKHALTIVFATMCGFGISPFLIESGGSTIYMMGKVKCPITGFEKDETHGVYPKIVCEGVAHLSAVESSLFTDSILSRNFRRLTQGQLPVVSKKIAFVCRKVRFETLTILNLLFWKAEFTTVSHNFHLCKQAEIRSFYVPGDASCRPRHQKCLI